MENTETHTQPAQYMKSKRWHIIFALPTIAGYYLFWYAYMYLVLKMVSSITDKHKEKLQLHDTLLPYVLLSMLVSVLTWNLLPHGSTINISILHLARFLGMIYDALADDFARIH